MKFKLKPKELMTWKYWLHLLLLAVVVLGILQLWQGGSMLTLKSIIISVPLLAIGDVIAHTLLGID